MTDYYLFHQNMNLFDGSDAKQNSEFNKAMLTISGRLNKGQVVAAGFTEVIGLGTDAVARVLYRMADHLDTGLVPPVLFATGVPDSKYGMPEYTAISVNIKFQVKARGRVMRVSQKDDEPRWECVSDEDVPISDVSSGLPATTPFESDSRGLAYVCGNFGDQKMIVGFTHKISGVGRDETYQALIGMMQLIWDKHPDYDGHPTIFGGDFKFTPSPMGKPYYAIYACAPTGLSTAAPSTDGTDNTQAPSLTSVPLATSGNRCFDFWIANEEITNDYASVYGETNDEELSDHCGIALRLPMEVEF